MSLFAVEDSCIKENYDFGGADIRMVNLFMFSNYQSDASTGASVFCEIYAGHIHARLK